MNTFREALAEHLKGRFIYGFHREVIPPNEIKNIDVHWDEGESSDNEDYDCSPRLPALTIEVILTDNSRVIADPGWVIGYLMREALGLG